MQVSGQVYKIPTVEIFSDDEFNCRGRIAPIDVVDLARSIEDNGLQSPILVQPIERPPFKYRIISGHRRFAAVTIVLKAKTIECIVREGLDELTARKLNLEENLKRKDLNILQEAKAIEHFKKAGWTEEEISKEIGMSRGWVQIRGMVLSMPPDIQIQIAAGFLTQEQIRQVYTLKEPEQQYEAVRKIKDAKMAGEKPVKIKPPKSPKEYLAKRPRQREEIFQFIELVIDLMGGNFATRCMAWSAGEISDLEIHRDLKELCEEKGIRYEIPGEMLSALRVF